MSLLEVDELSFSYGDRVLYRKASFALNQGEHMGLVGANGTGKTTLIRLLKGELVPDEGRILWQKASRVGYIDQYLRSDDAMTLYDFLKTAFAAQYEQEARMLDLYRNPDAQNLKKAARIQEDLEQNGFYEAEVRLMQVADGLGLTAIGLTSRMGQLSGGQRTKTLLAKLLLQNKDVLLLDEPTNYLDRAHIQWLSDYLNHFEGACIIVSHDSEFLEAVADCIVCVDYEKLTRYPGRYSAYRQQQEQRREEQKRQSDAQKRQIDRLESYIEKNRSRASTAKMAKSRMKMLNRIERISAPEEEIEPRFRFQYREIHSADVLRVENLSIGYTHPILPPLSFILRKEKLAVTGFNGIGKTTLIKTLMGTLRAFGGSVHFMPNIQIGYFAQSQHWEDAALSPLQIMTAAFPQMEQKRLRGALAGCGIRAEHVQRPIEALSGGEQSKVRLCLLSLRPYHLLILDEPTNHLDQKAREALAKAIREFPGAVILVCHEEAFYAQCTDRVLQIGDLS